MTLHNWLDSGDLQEETPSPDRIARLFQLVARDIADAEVAGISADRRFNTAYEAALALAVIVVRAAGYRVRPSSGGHHWLTFAVLPAIMGPEAESRADYYQACRRKRHQATYEGYGVATAVEVQELIADVKAFEQEVTNWLRQHHPDLVPPENAGRC
jgi:hypothetical protein